jgi:hypothetical protein
MIKKDVKFKWTYVEKEAFEMIKVTIVSSPALQILDFTKEFLLYTFASDHSLVALLNQKDQQGNECTIVFMSTGLQGVEINYPPVDK